MVGTQLRVYNHPGRSIMARTRRTYTPEFKAEAVKLVTEQGYSIAEAARSLGSSGILIRNWKASPPGQRPTGLSRTRQTLPLRGGKPPPPCREQAAPDRTRHFKKSGGVLRQGGDMTYPFIEEHQEQWPVCCCAKPWRSLRPATTPGSTPRHPAANDGTPSWWRSAPSTPRSKPVTAVHVSMPSSEARGHDCCVNTVAKLMREAMVFLPKRRGSSAYDRLQP